jgi:hypothetical protein
MTVYALGIGCENHLQARYETGSAVEIRSKPVKGQYFGRYFSGERQALPPELPRNNGRRRGSPPSAH